MLKRACYRVYLTCGIFSGNGGLKGLKGSENESDKYAKQSITQEAVEQLQASEKLIAGELIGLHVQCYLALFSHEINFTSITFV